jgi:GNAT superfamily N-acetyltransferase
MAAQMLAPRSPNEGIRPFLIQRDLPQLASLIEVAFQPELDRTGNLIVAEMRQLARAGPLLWLLGASQTMLSPLLGGYVWTANGQLVGNVTLSLENRRRGLWTISNVAVHPDFRGRGIARQLMEVALQEANSKGAQLIALEVRTDNVAAQRLYRELGFEVYDTTSELSLPAHNWPERTTLPSLPLRKRCSGDGQGLYNLLRAATPGKAQEVRPIPVHHYRMGMERRLTRWLDDLLYRRRSADWVLEENGPIVAWLQLTGQYRQAAHRLQITVHPERRGVVEEELLAAGLYRLNRFPAREIVSTISTSHSEAQQAYRNAGFRTVRLLDQMRLDLRYGKDRTMP